MNSENISPKGKNLDEESRLIDLIKDLPEGTISGIRSKNIATIRFCERLGGDVGEMDVVRISADYNNATLTVNVPRNSTYSLRYMASTLSFKFNKTRYMICPVKSFNNLE